MNARSVFILALVGCSLPEVDLEGKACPCAPGYSCDASRNRCVRGATEIADAAPMDAGERTDAGVATFGVSQLSLDFITSRGASLRWRFEGTDFDSYRVRIGASEDEVRKKAATTRVLDAAAYPELRNAKALGWGVASTDLSSASVLVLDLSPGSHSFAAVEGVDSKGRVTQTNVVTLDTLAPTNSKVLFADAAAPSAGKGSSLLSSGAYSGQYCYGFTEPACSAGTCDGELALNDLDLSITGLSVGTFPNAMLEFAVAGDASGGLPQDKGALSTVALAIDDRSGSCVGAACRWGFSGWAFAPNSAYRLVQIPLRLFTNEAKPSSNLAFFVFTKQNGKVQTISISGPWKSGASIRLDEVRIRW